MILPGTLVQYVANRPGSLCRPNGIYTVSRSAARVADECGVCGPKACDAPDIWLCEVAVRPDGYDETGVLRRGGWAFCAFRIIAPPITEADRLECSAPSDGGAKQPSTPSPKIKVPGSSS